MRSDSWERLPRSYHGSGCTLASAIAAMLANGLDPEALARKESAGVDISGGGSNSKAWRDIWSAGQGIGAVTASLPAAEYVDALAADYEHAKATMRTRLSYRSS